jgi:hypothetical protein
MPEWKDELYKYITGIIHNNNKHKLIVINGTSNHIHIFAGYKPISRLSEFIAGYHREFIKMDLP